MKARVVTGTRWTFTEIGPEFPRFVTVEADSYIEAEMEARRFLSNSKSVMDLNKAGRSLALTSQRRTLQDDLETFQKICNGKRP